MKATLIALAALFATWATTAVAEPHEIRLSHPTCEYTYIAQINSRLGHEEDNSLIYDDPKEVGSAVVYVNGKYGVSYEYIPALSEQARIGDKVRLCKVAEYVNCPVATIVARLIERPICVLASRGLL
jgi:hypothetical protein